MMSTEKLELGNKLGFEAVDHIVKLAEDYGECEAKRIDAVNQPDILALKTELSLLREQEQDLRDRIRLAPPQGDFRLRHRRSLYYWGFAIFLAVAGFFFSLLAFDPYQLGWKSYLYCGGIAVVSPFCLDRLLRSWGNQKLIPVLSLVAFLAGLASLILLATIRGDVLAQHIQNLTPVLVIEGEGLAPIQQTHSFYDSTLFRLRLLMALLALAMEIAAGLALHEAWRLGSDSDDNPTQLRRELEHLYQKMLSLLHQISALQNESEVFLAKFWRDFYRAMLNGTMRSALTKLSVVLFGLLFPGFPSAAASRQLHVVVALDLSKSVAVKGHDNKAEYEKNCAGVMRLLSRLPAGSRVAVVGITQNSFAQPYVLLAAKLDGDEGYFQERLTAARQQTVKAWQKRTEDLEPHFMHTDIFGALVLTGQMFKRTRDDRRVLVIFSDMRHEAFGIDLERPAIVSVPPITAKVERAKLLADLQEVEVYVLGVDAAGKDVAYWESLREFWTEYFRRSGAALKAFSVTRDLPLLESE